MVFTAAYANTATVETEPFAKVTSHSCVTLNVWLPALSFCLSVVVPEFYFSVQKPTNLTGMPFNKKNTPLSHSQSSYMLT